MIKRKEEISIIKDREYLSAENTSYDKLVKCGYRPQGVTKDFKNVVVFRIKNEHRNNETKEVFYFNNWQKAAETLCS
jgi:hypothetical protein